MTTRSTWTSAGEPVADHGLPRAEVQARRSPLQPPQGSATSQPPLGSQCRPVVSPDTEFFWAGTAAGELRVQRCDGCGTLRHPPGPMCPSCGNHDRGPGVRRRGRDRRGLQLRRAPSPAGARQEAADRRSRSCSCPEGVRMVGELLGAAPDQVRIGLPVRAEFVRVDDDLTLPAWRATPSAVAASAGHRRHAHVRDLLGAGHPRLPGRAPRPGPRGRAGARRTSSSTS